MARLGCYNDDWIVLLMESRTFVFDAVGTLIRPVESISAIYQQMAASHGLQLDRSLIKSRFQKARTQVFSNGSNQETNNLKEALHWSRVVSLTFPELAKPVALFADLWEYYAQPESWQLFDDAADCLARLLERESNVINVAIASNFDKRLLNICSAIPELAQINAVFCSGEIGFAKPDPRFFLVVRQTLESQHGVSSSFMMIGDDLKKDILPAKALGWEAFHVDRPQRGLSSL